jgi:thiaminase
VDLAVEPGPFTLGLSSYLRALLTQGYELALVALYCAERVYFDAWSAVGPQSDQTAPYWPLIQHLSTDDSRDDMEAIATLVNTAASAGLTEEMKATFEMVVRFELLFWSEVFAGVGGAW